MVSKFCSLCLTLIWSCMADIYLQVDEDMAVGVEAFSRIASAVPIIANVVISENLFKVLTKSTGGRLQFSVYDKYLSGLDRLFHVHIVCNYFNPFPFLTNTFYLLLNFFRCLEFQFFLFGFILGGRARGGGGESVGRINFPVELLGLFHAHLRYS